MEIQTIKHLVLEVTSPRIMSTKNGNFPTRNMGQYLLLKSLVMDKEHMLLQPENTMGFSQHAMDICMYIID